MHNAIMIHNF